jgi:hypothetical protein
MSNVGMLASGIVLAIVATGVVAETMGVSTRRLAGAAPMVQVIVVPAVTN